MNRLSTLRATKADEESLSPTHCERGSSRMSVDFSGVGDRQEALYFQYTKDAKAKGGVKGAVTACNTARSALFTVHPDLVPFLETPVEKIRK